VEKTGADYRIFSMWRFIAALLVMAYHFCHFAPNADAAIVWFERMSPLLDMFFTLSGFLIYERYGHRILCRRQYARFLLRRFSRLYPLHLVTLTFFIAVGVAAELGLFSAGSGAWRYDFSQLLPNLLLLQSWGLHDALTFNYVSWSLSAEWFAYLLLPLVAFAASRAGLLGVVALLALLVGALEWIDPVGVDGEPWYDAKTWAVWRVFADFVFGAIIAVLAARSSWRMTSQWPAWIAIVGAAIGMQAGMTFYPAMATIGLAIFLGAIAERTRPENSAWMKPFMPIAVLSFGVYIWHPVIETVMCSFVWRRLLEPHAYLDFYAFLPLPMLISVAAAAFSIRFLEKPIGDGILAAGARVLGRIGLQPVKTV
jgi:peptidoglycan/LPS O-acetylase OafA/YrhL